MAVVPLDTCSETLTVGIAQIAPVWLDRAQTRDKMVDWVNRAADHSCHLVAFGEALLPGYPFWVGRTDGARFNSPVQKEIHAHYMQQAVQIEAGDLAPICKAAAERRKFGEAVSFLENAIEMDGEQAEFRLELGRLLTQNPRHRATAEEHLRTAAELDPSNPQVYVALADLYGRMDRADDALRALREALRWDPGNQDASRRLRELGHDPDGGDGGIFGSLFGR